MVVAVSKKDLNKLAEQMMAQLKTEGDVEAFTKVLRKNSGESRLRGRWTIIWATRSKIVQEVAVAKAVMAEPDNGSRASTVNWISASHEIATAPSSPKALRSAKAESRA